jgi:lipoyl(octanoyl) transferase
MKVVRPGLVPYGQALATQLALREGLQGEAGSGREPGYILCLEHPPVITLGKRGKLTDLFAPQWLIDEGIEVYQIDRGGEATYHGPGQLVIYPIVRLDVLGLGVVDVIRTMAAALAAVLESYGVDATYDPDHPGLWTTDSEPRRKIASVGMRVSRGVSTHGAAINLVNDLRPFSMFVPCGMPNTPMTRLQDYVESPVAVEAFTNAFLDEFSRRLGHPFETVVLSLPPSDQWIPPLDLSSHPLLKAE